MVGPQTFRLGSETEGQCDLEGFEQLHLPVEPRLSVWSETVGPAQPGSQMAHAEVFHPADCRIEARSHDAAMSPTVTLRDRSLSDSRSR
jgi:hypothetical protein